MTFYFARDHSFATRPSFLEQSVDRLVDLGALKVLVAPGVVDLLPALLSEVATSPDLQVPLGKQLPHITKFHLLSIPIKSGPIRQQHGVTVHH